jgi:hypothetical protein
VRELARVARHRVVLLTIDPFASSFWLADYFPQIGEIDRLILPEIGELESELEPLSVVEVSIPHDCSNGFLSAYWRRPAAYLDAGGRRAISAFCGSMKSRWVPPASVATWSRVPGTFATRIFSVGPASILAIA